VAISNHRLLSVDDDHGERYVDPRF
jgi:hypothetical protein